MSAAPVVIAPTPEFTVQALQALWAIPNPQEIPATPPGLILFDISASSDDVELFGRHLESELEDESENHIRQYPLVAVNETSNPGPWLSESIIDCLLSPVRKELKDAELEHYGRLRIAQEFFRGHRHDGLHTIPDESGNTFNTARDGLGLAEDKEKYSWEPKPKKKATKKIKLKADDKDKTSKVAAFTLTSDDQLDLAYDMWVSAPTPKTQGEFYEALFGFIKGRFPHAKGIKDLVQAGELDDALSEVVLEMMGTLTRKLERGEVLDGPACHYVTKAMSNSRKGAAIDFADYKKTYLSDGYESEDSNEEYDSSRLDDIVDNGWLQGRFDSAPDAEYAEDIQDERKVWLRQQIEHGTLPAQLRAVAHLYFIQGKTQVECAEELGIAQGTISKHKGKIQEYIKMKKASK
jgi:hypothetical protein